MTGSNDNLQKKAVRRIEYCINVEEREDTDIPCKKYKIESLRLRRKRNLVKIGLMFTQSTDVQNLKVDTVKTNLRSKNKVRMKNDFTGKTSVLNSPLYRWLRLWDSLPSEMQKNKDNPTFREKNYNLHLLR